MHPRQFRFRQLLLVGGLLLAAAATAGPAPPAVSAWERLPDLPLPRAGGAVAWLGDRLVVAGGTYWQDGSRRYAARVDAWDPAGRRWEGLPPLPVAAAHGGTASDGSALYILGGTTDGGATAACWELRRAGGGWKWSPLPDLPRPRTYGAAAVVGGGLYLAGGCSDPADLRTVSGEVLRLDLSRPARGWRTAAPIPGQARCLAAPAVDREALYLFGGCHGNSAGKVVNLAETLRYDAERDRWRAARPMPRAMRAVGAASLGRGGIALVGGYSAGPEDMDRYGPGYGFERRVLLYDAGRNRYREAAALPGAAAVVGAAARDGRLYVVGGEDRARSRTGSFLSVEGHSLPETSARRPVLVALGDSVTDGVRRSGVLAEQTYPRVLERLLSGSDPSPWVVSAGRGGETTRMALERFGSVLKPLPRVDYVVVMYGLNDAALIDPGPMPRRAPRVPLPEYVENLRSLVREGRRHGARVLLATPNPMTRAYAYSGHGRYAEEPDMNFLLRDYAEAVRRLAREEGAPLVDVDRLFRRRKDWESLLPDGIHPNAEGLALIAAEVGRVLKPAPER